VEVVIGQPFTFSVLFVDASNTPIAVTSPAITIFNFSALGVKQTLISAALSEVTPAETGRYIYVYTIPGTFTDGDTIYGEMSGTDPGSGDLTRVTQTLTLISSNRGLGGAYPGLIARFF
jgi:hypothetical protein